MLQMYVRPKYSVIKKSNTTTNMLIAVLIALVITLLATMVVSANSDTVVAKSSNLYPDMGVVDTIFTIDGVDKITTVPSSDDDWLIGDVKYVGYCTYDWCCKYNEGGDE